MLITLFELWVALDKVVVKQIPLQAKYSSEIPLILFESLLVRKLSVLVRVKKLYTYIKARHSSGTSSAFSSADDKSFAVRYFDQSPNLRSLKSVIEADAETERKKKEVLKTLNENYESLQKLAENLAHEYGVNSRGQEYQ